MGKEGTARSSLTDVQILHTSLQKYACSLLLETVTHDKVSYWKNSSIEIFFGALVQSNAAIFYVIKFFIFSPQVSIKAVYLVSFPSETDKKKKSVLNNLCYRISCSNSLK